MANEIKNNPEFTTDDTAKETPSEAGVDEGAEGVQDPTNEKETQSEASEDTQPAPTGEDATVPLISKEVEGLRAERVKLMQDIANLRGERREAKQKDLEAVDQKIDETLADVHPDDAALVEKVLRAKGYVRKDEVQKTIYESVKNNELDTFLAKHPEYKPENDPDDLNWSRLQQEFQLYKAPSDPKKIGELLERAHRAASGTVRDVSTPAKKRQVQVASVGAGGAQKSSSASKKLSPEQRTALQMGGWSDEDITNIENNLSE